MSWVMRMLTHMALNRSDAALVKAAGGTPRTALGRTLDPRFQFIEAQSRKQPTPAVMTPELGRAGTRQLVQLFGGKLDRSIRFEPTVIPLQGRQIPARIYWPQLQQDDAPLMVFYHFGGGVVGDLDTCHAFCGMLAVATEGPVLSVDYRLAPEHRWPAGIDDALDSFRWAVQNAARFGAPADQAGVGGDSMGGNFSAIVAQEMLRTGGPVPLIQLLIYPATDVASQTPSMTALADCFPLTAQTMAWFMSQYLPDGANPEDLLLSPGRSTALAGLPPALIYTAGFDPLVDQGAAYAEALRQAGVAVTYRCYDSLAHGFTAFTGAIPAAERACRTMAAETATALKAAAKLTP